MSKFLSAACILTAIGALGHYGIVFSTNAAPAPKNAADGWTKHKSKGDIFSAEFPEYMQVESSKQHSNGSGVDVYSIGGTAPDKFSFWATIEVFKPEDKDEDYAKVAKRVAESAADKSNGDIRKPKSVTLSNMTGIAADYDSFQNHREMIRVFCSRGIIVVLQARGKRDSTHFDDAKRFLDSVTIDEKKLNAAVAEKLLTPDLKK